MSFPSSTFSTPRRALLSLAVMLGGPLIVAILGLLGFLAYQLAPAKIEVGRYLDTRLDYRLPPANPEAAPVTISLIVTAHSAQPQALVYRGGSLFEQQQMAFSGILVRHPKATFLFEGGIGSRIEGEFARNFKGWQKQLFGGYVRHALIRDQLTAAGVDPDKLDFLLLTHLHWDHAGVIKDFPGRTVFVTQEEHDGMLSLPAGVGTFKEQFDDPAIKWSFINFTDTPYGPFNRSMDMFGDGSIVIVPLAGHTPGGLGMFVTLSNGERYFFIGDVAWAADAIKIPAERIPFAEDIADRDPDAVRRELVLLRHLWIANPNLHIMPAHDFETLKAIPELPRSLG